MDQRPVDSLERKVNLFACKIFLDRSDSFVFYEGVTAAGIFLKDELCGNHIYIVSIKIRDANPRNIN